MLSPVEYYFTNNHIEDRYLDNMLAVGFFRTANYMLRTRVLLYNSDLYNLFHIRYDLGIYTLPKSMRKIYNRNKKYFYHKVSPFVNTREKEEMFNRHKNRFKGSNPDSLNRYLYDYEVSNRFKTYQVEIFDKETDELAAYSIFDLGYKSMASILGIFDQKYEKYSLGLYSMILEIEYGQQHNFAFYYPGYIADKPSPFNYKIRLGKNPQFFNWFAESWHILGDIDDESKVWDFYNTHLSYAEEWLNINNITYTRTRNPYYYMKYYYEKSNCLSSIEQFLIEDYSVPNTYFIVEYNSIKDDIIFSAVCPNDWEDNLLLQIEDILIDKVWNTLLIYKSPLYYIRSSEDLRIVFDTIKHNLKTKDDE